jgi:hypothetical protein
MPADCTSAPSAGDRPRRAGRVKGGFAGSALHGPGPRSVEDLTAKTEKRTHRVDGYVEHLAAGLSGRGNWHVQRPPAPASATGGDTLRSPD